MLVFGSPTNWPAVDPIFQYCWCLLMFLPVWTSPAHYRWRCRADMQGLPSATGSLPFWLQQPHGRLSHGPGFKLPKTSVSAPCFCFVAQSLLDWPGGLPAGRERLTSRWIGSDRGGGSGWVIVGFYQMGWGRTIRNLVYLGMYGKSGWVLNCTPPGNLNYNFLVDLMCVPTWSASSCYSFDLRVIW